MNKSTQIDICAHLNNVDRLFVPPLSSYVDISNYGEKLANFSDRIEIWSEKKLVGLLAYYLSNKKIYISNVSLEASFQGIGLARGLFTCLFQIAERNGIQRLELKVNMHNVNATKFYFDLGFCIDSETDEEMLLVYLRDE